MRVGRTIFRMVMVGSELVVFGGIITVAVAAACSLWGTPSPTVNTTIGEPVGGLPGGAIPRDMGRESTWTEVSTTECVGCRYTRSMRCKGFVGYCQINCDDLRWRCESGWPMLAFQGRSDGLVSRDGSLWTPTEGVGTLPLEARGGMSQYDGRLCQRAVALHPIWRGLLIDIAIYMAIAWALFVVPPMTRRELRRRRGICMCCRYPLGGTTRCPECGLAAPVRGS